MTIYSGFSHEQWWFSIVMLVYQRVHERLLFFSVTQLDGGFPVPENHPHRSSSMLEIPKEHLWSWLHNISGWG